MTWIYVHFSSPTFTRFSLRKLQQLEKKSEFVSLYQIINSWKPKKKTHTNPNLFGRCAIRTNGKKQGTSTACFIVIRSAFHSCHWTFLFFFPCAVICASALTNDLDQTRKWITFIYNCAHATITSIIHVYFSSLVHSILNWFSSIFFFWKMHSTFWNCFTFCIYEINNSKLKKKSMFFPSYLYLRHSSSCVYFLTLLINALDIYFLKYLLSLFFFLILRLWLLFLR